MSVEEIKDEIIKKDKSKFLTFLFFLLISGSLWFLIKLSKDYSTQTVFNVVYVDAPVNKWVSNDAQQVKLSFVADGFITLRHNMVRAPKRVVEISLAEVPYRLEGGNTYSYGSQYLADRVADWLGVPAGSVTVNDDKQYFNMEDLQHKDLFVLVPLEVKTQRQYLVYGEPLVDPATVTVYGPKSVLDTMNAIFTLPFVATGANADLVRSLPINYYGGAVKGAETEAKVTVRIEQYTETQFEVPVTVDDSLMVRFFPEAMVVRCIVPIRDYANLNAASFRVSADTAQLHRRQPLLDISLVQVPKHVQVLKTEPDQVEYLIVN